MLLQGTTLFLAAKVTPWISNIKLIINGFIYLTKFINFKVCTMYHNSDLISSSFSEFYTHQGVRQTGKSYLARVLLAPIEDIIK